MGYTTPVTVFTVHFPLASWNAITSSGAAYNWNGKVGDGAKLVNPSAVIDYVLAPGDAVRELGPGAQRRASPSPNADLHRLRVDRHRR